MVSASACVIKDRWTPSSKRMCPSTVVSSPEMSAIAVLRRQTLVYSAVRGREVTVVNVPVDVVVSD